MADSRILDIADGNPAESADEIYVNRAGVDKRVSAESVGQLAFGTEVAEQSDPSTPAANKGILFFRDDGSGKTQLCVRFPSGLIVNIATDE